MSNDHDSLLVEPSGDRIVRLVINRPPANALDSALTERLGSMIADLARTDSPPVLVLSGQGQRFFCAGGDIGEFASAGADAVVSRMRTFHALLCAMETYPAAIVSAVRGYAVGGGLELLLFSDYVVASTDAKVGFPEINHGLLPAAMGMRQAATKLGRRNAEQLLYSGTLIDAERAREAGILYEIVASDDVETRALAVATEMSAKQPHLFAAIKRSIGLTRHMTNEELETMSATDIRMCVEHDESAQARKRFLDRGKTKAR